MITEHQTQRGFWSRWLRPFHTLLAEPRLRGLLVQSDSADDVLFPWHRVESIAKSQSWFVRDEDGLHSQDATGHKLRLAVKKARLHRVAQRAQARWFRNQLRSGEFAMTLRFDSMRGLGPLLVVSCLFIVGYAIWVVMTSFLRFVGTDQFKLLPPDIKVLWWVATGLFLLLPMGISYVGIRVSRPVLGNRYTRVAAVDETGIAAVLANSQAVEFPWRDLVGVRCDGHLQFHGGRELWLFPPRGRAAALLRALSKIHNLDELFEREAKPVPRRMAAIGLVAGLLGTAAIAAWVPPDRPLWEIIPAFWFAVIFFCGAPLILGSWIPARIERRWNATVRAREKRKRRPVLIEVERGA